MKTYKDQIIKTLDTIYCDVCGSNCNKNQLNNEYGTLEAYWGYSSKQDGVKYEIHLCEICFMDTLDSLKKKRQKILGCAIYPYKNDPMKKNNYS